MEHRYLNYFLGSNTLKHFNLVYSILITWNKLTTFIYFKDDLPYLYNLGIDGLLSCYFIFFKDDFLCLREHSSVDRDALLHAGADVRTPNTSLIHLKKSEFQPLDYITKKKTTLYIHTHIYIYIYYLSIIDYILKNVKLTHHKHKHNINFTYTILIHRRHIQHKIHTHNCDVTICSRAKS